MAFNHARPQNPPEGLADALPLGGRNPPLRMKNVELGKASPDRAVDGAARAEEPDREKNGLTKDELKDALKKTLEVVDLLCPRRHLEYEVIEEADIVQVQVVNTDDGSIVRKIPSDDIVKLVEQIRQTLSDRFEVEA